MLAVGADEPCADEGTVGMTTATAAMVLTIRPATAEAASWRDNRGNLSGALVTLFLPLFFCPHKGGSAP